MAKKKTVYVCQNCGADSAKWIGRCPSCNQWNTYVEEVVTRYLLSPAIWGWEFSNEFNLQIDLPGLDHLPAVHINLGTPATRTEADKPSTRDMMVAIKEFGETVRKFDASRIIFTGNSIPRPAAYHLNLGQGWTQDNVDEYNTSLRRHNPDPINSTSIHFYGETDRFKGSITSPSICDIIRISMDQAKSWRRPLFIGEFGVSLEWGPEKEQSTFMEILECIELYGVPLSCVWVFDYPQQNSDWNITFDNSRKYMLEEIGKLNRKINNP